MNVETRKALAPEGMTVLITMGNSLRGDDGAGPYIGERLSSSKKLTVINVHTVFESVVQKIIDLKPRKIIMLDAANFGGKPGEIRLLSVSELSKSSFCSTHNLPLELSLDIIEKDTAAEIVIAGIQMKNAGFSEGLSEEVKEAALRLVEYFNKIHNDSAKSEEKRK